MKTRGWKIEDGARTGRAGSLLPAAAPSTQNGAHGVTRPTLSCALPLRLCASAVTLVLISVFSFQVSAFSQSYAINWHTIDGGGGTSTGGVYSVSGTIGQPDASLQTMTGGNYSLTGGFWALYAVQTPGAPLLTITLTTNTAVVWWAYPSTGWDLQENGELSTTNWVTPSETINNDGTNNFIIVNPPVATKFYRLFKP